MTDTESVKKVFDKACKLGITQLTGTQIQDEVDSPKEKPDQDDVGCFDKLQKMLKC